MCPERLRREFHDAVEPSFGSFWVRVEVREEMKELFGGPVCRFRQHEFRSIDGDEDFLLIALDDEEVISEIGKEEEFPATFLNF